MLPCLSQDELMSRNQRTGRLHFNSSQKAGSWRRRGVEQDRDHTLLGTHRCPQSLLGYPTSCVPGPQGSLATIGSAWRPVPETEQLKGKFGGARALVGRRPQLTDPRPERNLPTLAHHDYIQIPTM